MFHPVVWGGAIKTAKRKRSSSKSKPPAKRKQTGGIYPPIHYPLGNYPGYDRVMEGRGLISKMRSHLKKDAIADCKDWLKRQQKEGRKPKKQTGSGKKRKPRKQTGAGKKRKQTGKKSKSRKQAGGCINSYLKGGGRKSLFDLKGLMKKADKLPWARIANWLDR